MGEHELRIGISGWTYAPWRGAFYPKGLVQKRELEYASRQLNSIEINGTFYSLQRPESFKKWAAETPDDFLFSVKGPKYITHMKKLADVWQPLANFFASGPLLLGKKLGPILWQFPPWLGFGYDRFADFMDILPRTSAEASALANEHNLRQTNWIWTEAVAETKLQYAFEIRHESFMDPDFIHLLRKNDIALVFADSAGKFPFAEDVTSDLIYIRLHGAEEIYTSGYTEKGLQWWADRINQWRDGGEPKDAAKVVDDRSPRRKKRDVYVYFDNDIKVHAPFDAIRLAEMLGIKSEGASSGQNEAPSKNKPSSR
jgi:uncharacterized protein YecE (DUF72 family)